MNEQSRGKDGRAARFQREAEITGRLDHPHIVRVIDVSTGDSDDPPYLVMERLEGRTLAQLLKTQGAFSPSRAVRLTLDG